MGRSLSLFRNNRHWRGLSVQVDPAQLPVTFDLVPPRWGFWAAIAAGLGWMVFTADMALPFDLSLLSLVGLLFPGAGLVLILFAAVALYERREVTFERDGVRVEGRSLAGEESWALPYTAFHGVLHRERVERRSRGSRRSASPITYQIIELVHEDPGKNLPLSVEVAEEVPRARWEDYARALDLPALEQSGDALVGRATGDLDKSLRELADEGKVAQRFDPEARVPKGISIAHEAGKDQIGGERLRITLTAARVPLLVLVPLLLLGSLGVLAGLGTGFDLVFLLVGGAFVGVAVLLYRFDRRKPCQIVITRKTLAFIDPWQGTGPKGRQLKLEEIESVTIQGGARRARIVIAADRDRLTLGGGLSRSALEWLKDYVTAAVATA